MNFIEKLFTTRSYIEKISYPLVKEFMNKILNQLLKEGEKQQEMSNVLNSVIIRILEGSPGISILFPNLKLNLSKPT